MTHSVGGSTATRTVTSTTASHTVGGAAATRSGTSTIASKSSSTSKPSSQVASGAPHSSPK
eukprot:3119749-Pyramimonas_sp.AAC.1